MTATVTEREIRSPHNGVAPAVDSPAVSTRTRARIPATQSNGQIRRTLSALRLAASRWWAWTARPLSLRASWRLSAIDPKRVPAKSGALHLLWRISNCTDRFAMFLLVLLAPTALTGPLRWLAGRPTRRAGFYLVTAFAVVVLLVTGKG
jgi:hypothetical protein